jgi:hypothetical protein
MEQLSDGPALDHSDAAFLLLAAATAALRIVTA